MDCEKAVSSHAQRTVAQHRGVLTHPLLLIKDEQAISCLPFLVATFSIFPGNYLPNQWWRSKRVTCVFEIAVFAVQLLKHKSIYALWRGVDYNLFTTGSEFGDCV